MLTIEDVILSADRRGMRWLRPHLPDDFCVRAGRALYACRARVLVVSGFHVAGRCETDGPPGAVALARAIRGIGGEAVLVSDGHAAEVLGGLDDAPVMDLASFLARPSACVIDAPRCATTDSHALCARLRAVWAPTAIVAVERCGRTADDTYRTMRGEDISDVTACLDPLFAPASGDDSDAPLTFAVGDGGNEIGMGGLAEAIARHAVTEWPCITAVDFPIIASVSNWGAYGLCAALSLEAGRLLLPDEETATRDLARVIAMNGLDGVTRRSDLTVDGRALEENAAVLRDLHAIVNARLS